MWEGENIKIVAIWTSIAPKFPSVKDYINNFCKKEKSSLKSYYIERNK